MGNFIEKFGIYDQQTLVLLNWGGSTYPATGGEVITLAKGIQTSV